MAGEISIALDAGDSRKAFATLRALGGRASRPSQCVRDASGNLTTTPAEVKEVRQQHAATIFQGQVVAAQDLRPPHTSPRGLPTALDVGPEATRLAYLALGRNKGVGRDGLPAENLQAGASALACRYSDINVRVRDTGVWPTAWCGGRSQEIFKRKGGPTVTDDYRTILLADHASKGLTGILQQEVNDAYVSNQPESQYGAIPRRGTDMAAHVLHSLVDYAEKAKLSIFVLYIDLTKAYDRVIRQLIYGWGTLPRDQQRGHLLELSVSPSAADWMLSYLDERGPLLQQWGVGPAAAEMMRALHDNAWVSVADLPTCVTSRTGGRQGCKLGALTFNGVYGIALDMIAWGARRAGITLELPLPDGPFWASPRADTTETESLLDAAFIDDEALAIMARTPQILDDHIDQLLNIIFDVFEKLHLKLNASAGKTEALLQYRGARSCARREARRQADGSLRIIVPGRDMSIAVVTSYKHLGVFTSLRECSMVDANFKASRMLQAYAPLSWKVFGSAHVQRAHKIRFLQCLLMSKLLFGIQVLTPTTRQIKKLNGAYMIVLRRIANELRFCRTEHTDRQIRELLGQPALECHIIRMRLKYLARVVAHCPRALTALLHARP